MFVSALLILALCLFFSWDVKAQGVKIGNITISDADAKAYFLDCYMRPDTAFASDEYNSRDFVKYSIGKIYKPWHIDAHIDTLYDGEPINDYYGLLSNSKPKLTTKTKVTYEHIAPKNGTDFIGYTIPRKPSETDYIKYLKRTGKL